MQLHHQIVVSLLSSECGVTTGISEAPSVALVHLWKNLSGSGHRGLLGFVYGLAADHRAQHFGLENLRWS
jgi:hypothetical protein